MRLGLASRGALAAKHRSAAVPTVAFRTFGADSPWNKPIPADAPVLANSLDITNFIATQTATHTANNDNGNVKIAGTENRNTNWGTPHYWASSADPVFNVIHPSGGGYYLPPEFATLRIPIDARPGAGGMDTDPNYTGSSDGEMTVWNMEAGFVAWLYNAYFDPAGNAGAGAWTARGGSVAYINGNGVIGNATAPNDSRNSGSQRGLNGAMVAYRYDEMVRGEIQHAIRFAIPNIAGADAATKAPLWPMIGSDGISTDPLSLPAGARLRLKSTVDPNLYHVEARPLIRALQKYGMILSDSGGTVEIKVESTAAYIGAPSLWTMDSLAIYNIPITDYEVIDYTYDWVSAPSDALKSGSMSLAPPSIPTNLAATVVGDTQIDLSWSAAPRATSYTLIANGVEISGITGTSYSHTGLTAGTEYNYRIRASDGTVNSYYSPGITATTTGAAPLPTSVDFHTVATWTGRDTNTVNFTLPAGVTSDHTCLVFLGSVDGTLTYTTPTGWTAGGVQTDGTGYVSHLFYTKGVSGGEVVSFAGSASTSNKGLIFASFSGSDGTADGVASAAETSSGTTNHQAPSITTTKAKTLPVSVLLERSSRNFTSPAGWTERVEFYGAEGSTAVCGSLSTMDVAQDPAGTVTGPILSGDVSTSTAVMWTVGVPLRTA